MPNRGLLAGRPLTASNVEIVRRGGTQTRLTCAVPYVEGLEHLQIEYMGSNDGATGNTTVGLNFNNDFGGNYYWNAGWSADVAMAALESGTAGTTIAFTYQASDQHPQCRTVAVAQVPFYRDRNVNARNVTIVGYSPNTLGTTQYATLFGGVWIAASGSPVPPITTVTITAGNTFGIGSALRCTVM